jgi:hypothetical protein
MYKQKSTAIDNWTNSFRVLLFERNIIQGQRKTKKYIYTLIFVFVIVLKTVHSGSCHETLVLLSKIYPIQKTTNE